MSIVLGLEVIISFRPGNGPLLENHGFTTICLGQVMQRQLTVKASHIKFFDAVVQLTLWLLWRYRNEFVFSAKRPKIELLLNDVKFVSFNWIMSKHKNISINWIE
nr:RNA-directed DNA polymerase, eukaryota, reverse transcriptase zinc-binding domain protein [Tanacetum cinerariifolium]